MKHTFTWVPDPEVTLTIPCPECGEAMEALYVTPWRSLSYWNWMWLCGRPGCRHMLPRLDSRSYERRACEIEEAA